ncbi:putative transcriptional regulator [Bernardetia litoralis DSM 6794]|uniref:Putative transcriptional regulator n=1 Tax=Bernardetia litoralis (strain ATCC 23117 / DSM 6794 / NBRC 15988 / NCIMB 1366 / Fx l1 / Sio-4) TaxID=880071 RepID=I4AN11_BERLS|nr:putative transcriptional regulator [Bernardetia litoralis DSM 6794]
MITLENAEVQMRKGILELCVLRVIANKEVYVSDLLQHLKESKLLVVEGTLYPLLNRLNKSGLVTYSWQESTGGPPRKYYRLTENGHDFLKQLTNSWHQLIFSATTILENTNQDRQEQRQAG